MSGHVSQLVKLRWSVVWTVCSVVIWLCVLYGPAPDLPGPGTVRVLRRAELGCEWACECCAGGCGLCLCSSRSFLLRT